MYEPKIHYLGQRPGLPLKTIACGVTVNGPQKWSQEIEKVTCYDCARKADGLTAEQRDTIWENANERVGKFKRSPWTEELRVKREQAAKAG